MRVLVVDDCFFTRVKLKNMLCPYGDCDGSPNGEVALRLFEQAHNECVPYELITMDLDLPGMKGIDVVSRMRLWEREREVPAAARVIMISSSDEPKSILASLGNGCEWFLLKPVKQEKLEEALAQLQIPRVNAEAAKETA